MKPRVLFLYLTKHSGHHAAAVSMEQALLRLAPNTETLLMDSFSHTNPVLSKVTLRAYLAVLKTAPEIWEYMYDNPNFQKRTRAIRNILNRGNSKKLHNLLVNYFKPSAVVCTQGFACGVMASWKRTTGNRHMKLVGVLTDFVAHRYWADPAVDLYIVPNEDIRHSLVAQGVFPERVQVTGIPINERFLPPVDRSAVIKNLNLRPDLPKILLMGGSLGLGPMKAVVRKIDRLPQPFDMIAVTGNNHRLHAALTRRRRKFRHTTRVFGFAGNINELMEIADLVVSKPGGITTAEALVKRVPMIVINPIPGQEAKNTAYLLSQHVAVQAETAKEVALYIDEFFRNPLKLRTMREAALRLGRPHSAHDAAMGLLNLMARP